MHMYTRLQLGEGSGVHDVGSYYSVQRSNRWAGVGASCVLWQLMLMYIACIQTQDHD